MVSECDYFSRYLRYTITIHSRLIYAPNFLDFILIQFFLTSGITKVKNYDLKTSILRNI